MSAEIGFIAAFSAGLLSFLSPCVLPLIPGYLSFLTGLSTAELSDQERPTQRVLVPALLFIAGFSFVFVALGASASVLGRTLLQYRSILEVVGGVAIMVFGVILLGVIRIPFLYGEARVDLEKSRMFGRAAGFVFGMAFAAGWTPCVGPILGTILALAGSTGDVGRGSLLLLVYSLGLGVPFLMVALLFGRLRGVLEWFARHSLVINRVAGSVLILLGAFIASGRMGVLATWLNKVLPTLPV